MLVVNGASQATAIIGNCDACSFISILNIIIDGSRPTLGQIPVAGGALIEIGGSTLNQVVDNVRAYGMSRDGYVLSKVTRTDVYSTIMQSLEDGVRSMLLKEVHSIAQESESATMCSVLLVMVLPAVHKKEGAIRVRIPLASGKLILLSCLQTVFCILLGVLTSLVLMTTLVLL